MFVHAWSLQLSFCLVLFFYTACIKVFHCHETKLWTLLWEPSGKYFKLMKTAVSFILNMNCFVREAKLSSLHDSVAVFSFCHVSYLNEYACAWQIDDLLQCSCRLLTEVLIEPLFAGILSSKHSLIWKQPRSLLCRDVFFWLKWCLLIAHHSRWFVSERASGKQAWIDSSPVEIKVLWSVECFNWQRPDRDRLGLGRIGLYTSAGSNSAPCFSVYDLEEKPYDRVWTIF